jgi:hypothetical protein
MRTAFFLPFSSMTNWMPFIKMSFNKVPTHQATHPGSRCANKKSGPQPTSGKFQE